MRVAQLEDEAQKQAKKSAQRKEGNPLMSSAIAAGLYHPNCKDVHTTYFPELDEEPDSKFTKEELEKVKEDYKQDQKRQYAGRMVEQFDRLSKYSLDPDNKKMYAARKEQWEQSILFNGSSEKHIEELHNTDSGQCNNNRKDSGKCSYSREDSF